QSPDVDSFAAPLEVRVGVTEHIEVHFEGVAYTWVEGDEGLPDFEIGGKANLYADSIFSAGVSGGVTVPLGFGDVASDGDYLLAAAGLVDVTLTPAVSLSVNIGFEQLLSDRGDGNRIPLGAALSFALGDIGLFIDGSRGSELSGDAALPTTTSFGIGGSYLLTDTVLLDTFVRRVASDELEGFVGGAGIAVVL
ncbi:MAG: transporter, partial [Myxococcota bacterium]